MSRGLPTHTSTHTQRQKSQYYVLHIWAASQSKLLIFEFGSSVCSSPVGFKSIWAKFVGNYFKPLQLYHPTVVWSSVSSVESKHIITKILIYKPFVSLLSHRWGDVFCHSCGLAAPVYNHNTYNKLYLYSTFKNSLESVWTNKQKQENSVNSQVVQRTPQLKWVKTRTQNRKCKNTGDKMHR